jgi:ABC-type oligopeptide transport system substrate-binding subunit
MLRRRQRAEGQRNHYLAMLGVLLVIGILAAAGSRLESSDTVPAVSPPPPEAAGPLEGGTLTVAFAEEPRSLDPAFATDRTSATLVGNVFDPLVRLGPDLQPEPALAREWRVSEDGLTVTFLLRREARWTNGEPVTAGDLEAAWKRVLSADLRSPLASQLHGIAGAARYNGCTERCTELRDAVGVSARGDHRLVVRLAARQPWFVRLTALPPFLPVHVPTVLRQGGDWAEPGTIVSNGPFVLGGRTENAVSLVRNPRYRGPARVSIARVEALVLRDARARVQAFDEGSVLALDGSPLPEADLPGLRERFEFESYPTLRATTYAFNLAGITDVRQRRAMTLAVDREAIVENATRGGEAPATRFLPAGMPLRGRDAPDSPWAPEAGDLGAARAELEQASVVKRRVTLLHVEDAEQREVALALAAAWRELGIETSVRSSPEESFLDFAGPLSRTSVDVYQLDLDPWLPDAWPTLALWSCGADANKTNFCSASYDALLVEAREEESALVRSHLYGRAEELLTGSDGSLPVLPVYRPTYTTLESLQVRDTFAVNPLGQIDFTTVALD